MKKKKNLKKKILGISLSALIVALPFVTRNVENVKAETCTDIYHYYAYSNVSGYNWLGNTDAAIDQSFEDGDNVRRTYSYFPRALPAGITNPNFDTVEEGKWITKTYRGHNGYWTDQMLVNKVLKPWFSQIGSQTPEKLDDTHYLYYHAPEWLDDDRRQEYTDNDDPSRYTDSALLASLIWPSYEQFQVPIEAQLPVNVSSPILGGIKRTYAKSDWVAKRNQMLEGNGTDGHIYDATLYEVKYKVCSADAGEYTVTTKYLEEGTDKELATASVKSYAAGANYSTSCKSEIPVDDITYRNSNTPNNLTGTVTSNIVVKCYYKASSSPTGEYKVTTNYLEKGTNKVLKDPKVDYYGAGDTYKTSCPDSLSYNKISYISANTPSNLTGTVTGNVTVNCLYSSGSAKTSDIPIYIVWGIGGAALAYSIYFFRKYYKEQNEV